MFNMLGHIFGSQEGNKVQQRNKGQAKNVCLDKYQACFFNKPEKFGSFNQNRKQDTEMIS